MTHEELNRTLEFIVASQARLAAAQEQDREERVHFERSSRDLDHRLANLIELQSRALEIQSRRLDDSEKQQRAWELMAERREQAAERRHEEFQMDVQKRHEEVLAWLRRILEKITERMN